MKKRTFLMLAVMAVVSLSACGGNSDVTNANTTVASVEEETQKKEETAAVSATYNELVDGVEWDFSETKKDHAIHVDDLQYDLCTDNNGNKFALVWAKTDKDIHDVVEEKGTSYPVLGLQIKPDTKKEIEEFAIPGHIMYINNNCFEDCDNLNTVIVPDSVIYIGERAFAGCDLLEKANIPEGITKINRGTFSGCSKLTEMEIPDTVTYIGECAFANDGFTNVDIPESVTEIDKYAFQGCSDLQSFVFPTGVTKCSYGIFDDCRNLSVLEFTNPSIDLSEFVVFGNYERIIFPEEMVIEDETLEKLFKDKEVAINYQGFEYPDYEYLANVILASSLAGYDKDTVGDYTRSDTTLVNVQMFVEDIRRLDSDEANKTGEVFSFIGKDYKNDNVYAEISWEDDCWKMKVSQDDGWSISGHFNEQYLFYED